VSATTNPTRVLYTDRQFLQAADLQIDQAYHREMRWRHNLALHSWGILAGLEVTTDDSQSGPVSIAVSSGMALDGYGRELVLPGNTPQKVALDQTQSYDVWLVYTESSPPPPPIRGCGGSIEAGRSVEQPRVLVTRTAERQSPDVAKPNGVPPGDLDFRPERPIPGPESAWPVFLARLDFRAATTNTNGTGAASGASGTKSWVTDGTERRYAGLVAERIVSPPSQDAQGSPQKQTMVVNGSDPTDPTLRFAVGLSAGGSFDSEDPPFISIRRTQDATTNADTTTIGLTTNRVTVAGDVVMQDGSALEFQPNPVPLDDTTDVHADRDLTWAEYWRIYHHFDPPKKTAGSTTSPPPTTGLLSATDPPTFFDELRITMPGTPTGTNQVVIGCYGAQGKFAPVLAVKADKVDPDKHGGSVEVYGNLRVNNGLIYGRPAQLPAGTAIGSGTLNQQQIQDAIRNYLATNIANPPFGDILAPVIATPPGQAAVVAAVIARPQFDQGQVRSLLGSLWSDDRSKDIGTTSTSAPDSGFKDFLNALGGSGNARTKLIVEWLFSLDSPAADPIGTCALPNSPTTVATKLATPLANNANQLTALLTGLIGAGKADALITALLPAPTDAGSTTRRTSDLNAIGKALGTNSAVPATDAHDLLNNITDATVKAALSDALFDTVDHAKTILAGVSDATRKNLADALFDTPQGKDALKASLMDKLPDPVNTPSHDPNHPGFVPDIPTNPDTQSARLRLFFRYINNKSSDGTPTAPGFKQLRDSIKILAPVIDDAAKI
jgi:hypothetical protein